MHATGPVILGSAASVYFASLFPYRAWQDVNVALVSSDTSVTPPSLIIQADWDVFSKLAVAGVCGGSAFEVLATVESFGATRVGISLTYVTSCVGDVIDIPNLIQDHRYNPAPSRAFARPLVGPFDVGGTNVLRFNFSTSVCGDSLRYRLQSDWIATIDSSSLGSWVWEICPRSNIQLDPLALCVHYWCNGTFSLPSGIAREQTEAIQENILQGVGFDAAATSLELVSLILETVVMALIALGVFACLCPCMRRRNFAPAVAPNNQSTLAVLAQRETLDVK